MHIVLSVTNGHYYAMRNVYYWSITNNIIVTLSLHVNYCNAMLHVTKKNKQPTWQYYHVLRGLFNGKWALMQPGGTAIPPACWR